MKTPSPASGLSSSKLTCTTQLPRHPFQRRLRDDRPLAPPRPDVALREVVRRRRGRAHARAEIALGERARGRRVVGEVTAGAPVDPARLARVLGAALVLADLVGHPGRRRQAAPAAVALAVSAPRAERAVDRAGDARVGAVELVERRAGRRRRARRAAAHAPCPAWSGGPRARATPAGRTGRAAARARGSAAGVRSRPAGCRARTEDDDIPTLGGRRGRGRSCASGSIGSSTRRWRARCRCSGRGHTWWLELCEFCEFCELEVGVFRCQG